MRAKKRPDGSIKIECSGVEAEILEAALLNYANLAQKRGSWLLSNQAVLMSLVVSEARKQ